MTQTTKEVFVWIWRDIRAHWKAVLLRAIVGAVSLILLSETIRWLLGKGFFQ